MPVRRRLARWPDSPSIELNDRIAAFIKAQATDKQSTDS